jgi:hypothetical protein
MEGANYSAALSIINTLEYYVTLRRFYALSYGIIDVFSLV